MLNSGNKYYKTIILMIEYADNRIASRKHLPRTPPYYMK